MLDPLPTGTFVKVIWSRDPWLRQYSGMRARVEEDDGLIADVVLSGGQLMSFWRNEIEPLSSIVHGEAHQGPEPADPYDLSIRERPVAGFSLQAERRRAGLTQMAIATVMGVSAARISQIEGRPVVRSETAMRYVEALHSAKASAA